MSRFIVRVLLVVVVVMSPVFLLSAPAGAHSALETSNPAAGAAVSALDKVELTFTTPVESHLASIAVTSPIGQRLDSRSPYAVSETANSIGVRVSGVEPGQHNVKWRVTSTDGHATTGTFVFTVVVPRKSLADAAPATESAAVPSSGPFTTVTEPESAAMEGIEYETAAALPAAMSPAKITVIGLISVVAVAIFLRRTRI